MKSLKAFFGILVLAIVFVGGYVIIITTILRIEDLQWADVGKI
ncbi:MAG: hypothetical protein PWP49_1146 [Thermococcaceae archaeon]|nr:hypothetical protein [Thermococcaceae archaeon]MDN5320726.1 hypothetical protein [Thermococcaceae archaeon]